MIAGNSRVSLRTPMPRFVTGHRARFAADPHDFMTRRVRTDGDLVRLRFLYEAGHSPGVLMEASQAGWGVFARLANTRSAPTWIHPERATAGLDRRVFDIIRRRANGRDTGDPLSMPLAAHDDGIGMPDRQPRDETTTFLFAGHETTALAPIAGQEIVPCPSIPLRPSSLRVRFEPRDPQGP